MGIGLGALMMPFEPPHRQPYARPLPQMERPKG